MTLKTGKKTWLAALAACTGCWALAQNAGAQCASYTVSNGTSTFQAGTTDVTNHGDDTSTVITTPFAITFYGTTYASGASVRVCSNGFMQMVSTTSSTSFSNTTLPSTVSGPALMPYWDDLNTSTTTPVTKGIFTAVTGTAPSRQWIIEWRVGTGTTGAAITSNFEIVFTEGSNDFDFVYGTPLASTATATIGVQSNTSTAGGVATLLGFNTDGVVASGDSRHFTCVAPANGACCANSGVCSVVLSTACVSPSLFQGNDTACNTDNTCPSTTVGSCCSTTTAACTYVASSTACASPSVYTAGGACSPNTCAPVGSCCNTTTFVCTVTTQAVCGAGTWAGTATTCTTNPCPAPANDLCPNATVLSGSGPFPIQTLGQNISATPTTAFTPAVCVSSSRDVWYTFTPADGTLAYSFTLCNTVSGTLDTVLSIHSACPTATDNKLQTGLSGNCNDDGCSGSAGPSAIGGLTLTAGQTYWIRVARWSTGTGGNFRLDITTEPFGACCTAASACSLATQSACTATSGNVFVGGGTLCSTSGICSGACCNAATGVCTFTTAASCTGTHGGIGSVCTTTFCPTTTCCNDSTGACTVTGTNACPAGTTANAAITCSPTPCPSSTCCNNATGACTVTGTAACPAGTTANAAATCSATPCPISTCCASTGACTVTGSDACPAGTTANAATSCSPSPCPPPSNDVCTSPIALSLDVPYLGNNSSATGDATEGPVPSCQTSFSHSVWFTFDAPATTNYHFTTCGSNFDTVLTVFSGTCASPVEIGCDDDTCTGTETGPGPGPASGLASTIASTPLTAGQTYIVRVSGFSTASGAYGVLAEYVPGTVVGSCCVGTVCTLTDSTNCTGTWTSGGACSPTTCAPAGVCCRGATCTTTITSAAACSATLVSGQFAGASFPSGAACNSGPISNAPCCYADYNKVGGISVTDIFDFLADWFSGSPYANTGGNGSSSALTVTNIFDFLNDWFAGGC